MNQPKRWLDSTPNPKIRELLRAGLRDEPDAQALPRTAALLGLGVTVSAASSAAAAITAGNAASAGAPLSALPASGVAVSGTPTLFAVGKWLVVGFLSGGIASAGVTAAQGLGSSERGEAQSAAIDRAALRNVARGRSEPVMPRQSEPAPAELVRPEPRPPLDVAPALAREAAPRATSDGKAPPTASGALAAEVTRIDAARRALASGDESGALAELEAYERTRTLGVLDREAGLLRIDALRRKGDLARARSVAEGYLRHFPDDAHSPRLREFLEGSK